MRIRLGRLRRIIEQTLNEEAWVPGRYYPATDEPMSGDETTRLNQPLGEDDDDDEDLTVVDEEAMASLVDPHPSDLDEVDTDPSNNPGRPADAFDYLGMHPKPEAAMSHPFAGGSSGGEGGEAGSSSGADPSEPPDEAPEGQ